MSSLSTCQRLSMGTGAVGRIGLPAYRAAKSDSLSWVVWPLVVGLSILSPAWFDAATCMAQPAEQQWPPANRVKNNLTIGVRLADRANHSGFRPLTVRLIHSPAGPAPTTRRFRVVFSTRLAPWENHQYNYVVEMELPQGSPVAERTIALPVANQKYRWDVDVFEGGRQLPELSRMPLSMAFTTTLAEGRYSKQSPLPCFLLVHSAAASGGLNSEGVEFSLDRPADQIDPPFPSSFGLATVVGLPARRVKAPTLRDHMQEVSRNPYVDCCSPSTAPASWLDWSGYDVVVIPLADLQRLAATNRTSLEGLRRWVESGGNLCVTGAPDDAERREIWRRMTSAKVQDSARGGWSYGQSPKTTTLAGGPPASFSSDPPAYRSPYRWRDLLAGRVVAVAAPDLFAPDAAGAVQLLNDLSIQRWGASRRWGAVHFIQPDDLPFFDIAGVGKPPVLLFLLLITVFVALIGPVNFILLRSVNRIQWMVLTVPLVAGAISLLIFFFAIVTDGFGLKCRVVSVTCLDQLTERAVSVCAQAYYAASSRRGLAFPEDSAVFMLEYSGPSRKVHRYLQRWTLGGEVLYENAYLPTRELSQMTVVRPQPTTAALRFVRDAPGELKVRNDLGANVQWLLVKDPEGREFYSQALTSGESSQLTLIPDPARRPREIAERLESANRILQRRSITVSALVWWNGGFADGAVASQAGRELLPGEYLAAVDRDPHTTLGATDARLRNSLFLIHGQWR